MSEFKTGIYNVLVKHLCSMWTELITESKDVNNVVTPTRNDIINSITRRRVLILQACTFAWPYL